MKAAATAFPLFTVSRSTRHTCTNQTPHTLYHHDSDPKRPTGSPPFFSDRLKRLSGEIHHRDACAAKLHVLVAV